MSVPTQRHGAVAQAPCNQGWRRLPTLVQELRAARRWHLMGICSQEAGRGCSRPPPRPGDPCSSAGLGGARDRGLSPLEGHRMHAGLAPWSCADFPGQDEALSLCPSWPLRPLLQRSRSRAPQAVPLLQPPLAHPPSSLQAGWPSRREPESWPSRPGRRSLGQTAAGWACPACLHGPASQDGCGKPAFLHSCRRPQPRASWPGEGAHWAS